MPLLNSPPHVRLLEASRAAIAAVTAEDWLESASAQVDTVRHARNRFPTKSEKNTISLRWVGNEEHDIQLNGDELAKRCNIDMQIALKLKPEDSGDDPTGWADIGRVQARAMMALRDPASPLSQLMWYIIDGDEDPDEESKPDEGRLVKRISVVYRVRTDDPNVLLALGENG